MLSLARWSRGDPGSVTVAILLDVILAILVFYEVHPGAVLLVDPLLVTMHCLLARALNNRTVRGDLARRCRFILPDPDGEKDRTQLI